jgi:putative flippase GtrA
VKIFKKITNRKLILQFLLYCFVGGFSSIIDIGGFYFFIKIGLHIYFSSFLSFSLATIFNYFLSYKIAFVRNQGSRFNEISKVIIISVCGLIINMFIFFIFFKFLHFNALLAKTVAILFVFLWNFSGRRYFVFSKEIPSM